jgi:hypothetical protein
MPWFGKISRQRPLHAVPISRLRLCTVQVPVNFAVLQMPSSFGQLPPWPPGRYSSPLFPT